MTYLKKKIYKILYICNNIYIHESVNKTFRNKIIYVTICFNKNLKNIADIINLIGNFRFILIKCHIDYVHVKS